MRMICPNIRTLGDVLCTPSLIHAEGQKLFHCTATNFTRSYQAIRAAFEYHVDEGANSAWLRCHFAT